MQCYQPERMFDRIKNHCSAYNKPFTSHALGGLVGSQRTLFLPAFRQFTSCLPSW